MDDMLAKAGKPRVILSSTDIPDRTKKISVGADDMLVNAIGHMNRRSRTYVFQDQGLVRDGGLIDFRITPKKNVPRPDYYIRGSISQLDSNTMRDDAGLDLEREGSNSAGLLNGGFSRGRTVSVVSVDLHLVKFPSRQVVPGLSVSNSMAVVSQGFGGGTSGVINLTGINLSLQVDRIESHSQAVRNLIELGVIELLGRHSGLPYWQCLSHAETSARAQEADERQFASEPPANHVLEAQEIMTELGLYDGPVDGVMTPQTYLAVSRFQDQQGLIANGLVDFDLISRLRKLRPAVPVSHITVQNVPPATAAQSTASTMPSADTPEDDGYLNLFHYLR